MLNKVNRRNFLQISAGALAVGLIPTSESEPQQAVKKYYPGQHAPEVASNAGKKPLRLGLILGVGKDPDVEIAKVQVLGLPTCQVYVENFATEQALGLRKALDKHGVEATSVVVGGPGKEVWDFYEGPLTIGLVPPRNCAPRASHRSRKRRILRSIAEFPRCKRIADSSRKTRTRRSIKKP